MIQYSGEKAMAGEGYDIKVSYFIPINTQTLSRDDKELDIPDTIIIKQVPETKINYNGYIMKDNKLIITIKNKRTQTLHEFHTDLNIDAAEFIEETKITTIEFLRVSKDIHKATVVFTGLGSRLGVKTMTELNTLIKSLGVNR